jgi:rod shape-determining protein MreD
MSTTLSEHLDGVIRFCVPYAAMFFLFTLNLVSFSAPLSTKIEIPFILMCVYYWSVYRPTMLPPFLVFGAGLYFDMLSGMPLGLNAFIFLLVRHFVKEQRILLTSQTFVVIWLGFMLVSSICIIVQWLLYGLINMQLTPYIPMLLMIISGILMFPAVTLILNLSHKVLPILRDHYTAVK